MDSRRFTPPDGLLDRAPVLQRDKALYQEPSRRNIENFIGTARVPVGLAGPLEVRGRAVEGQVWVPLATTEGTLVASLSRGMKVLGESGGVEVRVTRKGGIQRAPVFFFKHLDDALSFARTLQSDWHWLGTVVKSTTGHGALMAVRCDVVGTRVHVRLTLDAGDAAGQNMVSIAAVAVVHALQERFPAVQRVWMEGGYSGEKVPSSLNMLLGRGWSVVARAQIPGAVLTRLTRARPRDLIELLQIYATSALVAGQQNSHASLINVLPALYIATGQDVASVPESCIAHNLMAYDPDRDLLNWELVCPNLVCATVGGGTHLPTQRECLDMLGCLGPGKVERLVEIIAATALAGDVSFWSAICADEWVRAHASLRQRKAASVA